MLFIDVSVLVDSEDQRHLKFERRNMKKTFIIGNGGRVLVHFTSRNGKLTVMNDA